MKLGYAALGRHYFRKKKNEGFLTVLYISTGGGIGGIVGYKGSGYTVLNTAQT